MHALSPAFELVITAGGLGPTLDDVTMAGIAAALGTTLKRDATLEVLQAPPCHVQLCCAMPRCKLFLLEQGAHDSLIVPTHDLSSTGSAAGVLRAAHHAGAPEIGGGSGR